MKTSRLFFKNFELVPLTPTLALVTVAALGLLCPVSAAAGVTLDQAQPVSQSPANVGYSTPKAQIFTAGVYGSLDRVSLYLENFTANIPAGAVAKISVQTVIGGLPSGKQIGSGTIPLTAIPPPGSADWVDVGIIGAVVDAGTPYALVLQTSPWNAMVNWWHAYQNAYGSSYAGGSMAVNDGTSWRIEVNYDFAFKTYVFPDILDRDQWRGSQGGGYQGTTMGQIFTPTVSGVLDRVEVYLEKGIPALDVTIQTVAGGYPSGTVIGRGSIPAGPNALNWYNDWFTAPISGASVAAGTQYALVVDQGSGLFTWRGLAGYPGYPGGEMVYKDANGWKKAPAPYDLTNIAMYRTYVIPKVVVFAPPPPPATITPCSFGVCPAAIANVVPMDSTARVTSNILFQELPNGAVHAVLHFDDSKTGNFVLQGCTTSSGACRLMVKTFVCTDQHAITIAGTYTQKGEAAHEYLLILSGIKNGIGTFTLNADRYTYTLTRTGSVDVTCPTIP